MKSASTDRDSRGVCPTPVAPDARSTKLLAIVGSPNVGKSVLFNALTGAYATVSNYPGTTVEVMRGRGRIGHQDWEIVDTPGMYSLMPSSEEERVAASILLNERPEAVLHVIDAKNLERMLPLTLQLLEVGLPVILVLNIMDEAERRGIQVDTERLERELGVPVIPTVSTTGRGLKELKAAIGAGPRAEAHSLVEYGEGLEAAAGEISDLLPGNGRCGNRGLSLLLLQGSRDAVQLLDESTAESVGGVVQECARGYSQPLSYVIATERQRFASDLAAATMAIPADRRRSFAESLSRFLINPWTGIPVVALVLYYGLYKFVGELGAGVVVNYLEGTVFEEHLNPVVQALTDRLVPWQVIRDLIAGDYGMFTLGVRYAIAIILPIVSFFFLVFSIMEDSGYLPRLALLVDRLFKKIGLSGRGVIPIVLGFGCDTMATMVTRTLPSARERIIATMLLALAVPCSAQLGLILAILHGRPLALAIWAAVIGIVFLLIGFLAARLLPGESPHFYMELPPLRLPRLGNVVTKTLTRVHWYVKEVLPLFVLASVLIWLGELTGIFDRIVALLAYPVQWIGLPHEAAQVFLFGFFRRDYGAAGLYDLNEAGVLDGVQLAVSTIALTLFLPCVAQFLMNVKERGAKMGIAISVFVAVFAFVIAFGMNALLRALGVVL